MAKIAFQCWTAVTQSTDLPSVFVCLILQDILGPKFRVPIPKITKPLPPEKTCPIKSDTKIHATGSPIKGHITGSPIVGHITESSIEGHITESHIEGHITERSFKNSITKSPIKGLISENPILSGAATPASCAFLVVALSAVIVALAKLK